MTPQATYLYLGFQVDVLDSRHVTIYTPDGVRLVAGARMNDRSVRNFIRGYRYQDRLDQLSVRSRVLKAES